MNKVIVFAGTTEGREICSFLKRYRVPSLACTATEYGKCLLEEDELLTVRSGRMDEKEMEQQILKEQPELILDATHPYATVVSENIRMAASHTKTEYIRLLRPSENTSVKCHFVDSVEEAVTYLKEQEGNVFVTTGSKELAAFCRLPDFEHRVFARVLPLPGVIAACSELGFDAAHVIGMQGPFSESMNVAMLESCHASYLVTKESGRNGGFEEKIGAAQKLGVQTIVIGRPVQENGLDENEVKRVLTERFHLVPKRKVAIAGIGMGGNGQMTEEVVQAIEDADILIGAKRMLDGVKAARKPEFCSYRPMEIQNYILEHPELEKIVLLQSGDVGFYSGAKALLEVCQKIPETEVTLLPGISSVVYFCARLGMAWEDVRLISLHGRESNFLEYIRRYPKVFAIVGEKDGISNICRKLLFYGWNHVRLSVGTYLSYPEERVVTGSPEELLHESFDSLSVILFQNDKAAENIPYGIPDEEFLRDQVPMTKREVRNASLSHLALQPDSIVYDIGAGTGSVSVEMALAAWRGTVYAIEKNPTAVELLKKNRQKFGVDHLKIVEGLAPEAMEDLPVPTHAFIGGSSGNLKAILQCLLQKNPGIHVVLNTVTLETLAEAVNCIRDLPFSDPEVVCLTAAASKKAGHFHLMMGQNPVYLFIATGGRK